METYIKFEWEKYPKIRIIEIYENYICLRFLRSCVHSHIGYTHEWHEYIQNTCLRIKPNLENILKIPYKILNTKRLVKPVEKAIIGDSIRECL